MGTLKVENDDFCRRDIDGCVIIIKCGMGVKLHQYISTQYRSEGKYLDNNG